MGKLLLTTLLATTALNCFAMDVSSVESQLSSVKDEKLKQMVREQIAGKIASGIIDSAQEEKNKAPTNEALEEEILTSSFAVDNFDEQRKVAAVESAPTEKLEVTESGVADPNQPFFDESIGRIPSSAAVVSN